MSPSNQFKQNNFNQNLPPLTHNKMKYKQLGWSYKVVEAFPLSGSEEGCRPLPRDQSLLDHRVVSDTVCGIPRADKTPVFYGHDDCCYLKVALWTFITPYFRNFRRAGAIRAEIVEIICTFVSVSCGFS